MRKQSMKKLNTAIKDKFNKLYLNKKLLIDSKRIAIPFLLMCAASMLLPELASAADAAKTNAFDIAFKQISGWTGGSAGKLITFTSLIGAAVMGVLGFSGRAIMGAIGIGVLLSSSKAIVDMIFGA